jgi:serine/threonine protein phosphatase PrpC
MSTDLPVRLSWASVSDIGMRSSNQDTIGRVEQDGMACFVVSDGAGGHAGGEIASKLVVDAVVEKFTAESAFGARALLAYVGHAVASVARGKLQTLQHHDMSATVAALLVDAGNGLAVWAHLGDTRIYLFRAGRLHAVSKDHSLTQQLIDAGYARADQLREHPQRNILYAAIGAEGDTPVASSGEPLALQPGDAFLLCTDGLWEWVREADMAQALAAAADVSAWLDALCALARANVAAADKQHDNFSAYAVLVQAAHT